MIHNFEFFHGLVFARLLHGTSETLSIKTYPTEDNASYILNNRIGLYIKYSTKRLTPWTFSFQKYHQDEILVLRNKFDEVYTILVCNEDGLVCLNFEELKRILNEVHEEVEWIRVARRPGHEYSVSGKDGDLKFKIPIKDFPRKIFEAKIMKNESKERKIFKWF